LPIFTPIQAALGISPASLQWRSRSDSHLIPTSYIFILFLLLLSIIFLAINLLTPHKNRIPQKLTDQLDQTMSDKGLQLIYTPN
jgi:hypothetical protein